MEDENNANDQRFKEGKQLVQMGDPSVHIGSARFSCDSRNKPAELSVGGRVLRVGEMIRSSIYNVPLCDKAGSWQ
jgi:hypothetical protein